MGFLCRGFAQGAISGDATGAMNASKPARRRCTECRRWFHPAASAQQTQVVCCEECRKGRDKALARARRAKDLERYRKDEGERQNKCRQARREREGRKPPRVTVCHAPASAAKPPDLQRKVLQAWDKQMRLSRATLERQLAAILEGNALPGGTASGALGGVSRATLNL
jgi:hypothetical protein